MVELVRNQNLLFPTLTTTAELSVCYLSGIITDSPTASFASACSSFFYIASGAMTVIVDGKSNDVSAGQLFLLPPHQKLVYSALKDGAAAFRVEFTARCDGQELSLPLEPFVLVRDVAQVTRLLESLLSHGSPNSAPELLLQKANLLELLACYMEASGTVHKWEEKDREIQVAANYIHAHYNQPIALEELAALTHFDCDYFSKQFRKVFGTTPKDYMKTLRLDFAKQLLRTSELPVNQVAAQVGFSSDNYFSRLFKLETGVSPLAFRNHAVHPSRIVSKHQGEYFMHELLLFPQPKKLELLGGTARCDSASVRSRNLIFDPGYGPEEYDLVADEAGIRVTCRDEVGDFRALTTLRQLIAQQELGIPSLHIHDEPDFPHRGLLLDISRSKIPSMKTLFHIVDFLADVKVNQLQLYIEGFSFAYPSFPQLWADGTPITGEEIRILDQYCRERYIELVPNQNCFGHMSPWLFIKEFHDLAECPDGFTLGWDKWCATCLDPSDPRSLELVKTMFDDLLPNFSSGTVNIDCDETIELGWGKSKELCAEKGTEQVYFDYLLKIVDLMKAKGKTVQFWGDIIHSAPQLIKKLPEGVIPINWGYGPQSPSEQSCKAFHDVGRTFYLAPGTSSWNTILGDTDQMLSNIKNAAFLGKKYRVTGILNTDWGDLNHLQYLPVSYPGFAYGAAMSWNGDPGQEKLLCPYLNKFIFKDTSNTFAQLLLDAGRYHQVFDASSTKRGFVIGVLYYPLEDTQMAEGLTKAQIDAIRGYLNNIQDRLNQAHLGCEDKDLILDEFRNGLRILQFTCSLALYKIGAYEGGSKETQLDVLRRQQEVFLPEHRRLWLARNREGGLKDSIARMQKLNDVLL